MTWLVLGVALAQNPHLPRGISQLENLDEAGAVRTLEKARAWPKNTPKELALIHLYLGLAHAGLSHGKQAIEAFGAALIIDPELTLPGNPSPRILEWWQKAGGKTPQPAPPPEPEPAPPPPKTEPPPPQAEKPPEAPAPAPVAVQAAPPEAIAAPAPRSRAGSFLLGGSGVLLLGGGIGGLVFSLNTASAYQRQQPGGPNASSPTVSRADAAAVQVLYPVSIAALVFGAALLAVGALTLL